MSTQDDLVSKSLNLLQNDFIIIGKTRVRSWEAWVIIGFLVGVTVTGAWLGSRSGTLEEGYAATTDEIKLDLRYLRGKDPNGFTFYQPNVTGVAFYREIKPRHFLGVNSESDITKVALDNATTRFYPTYDSVNKILTWRVPSANDYFTIPLSSSDLRSDNITMINKVCPLDTRTSCWRNLDNSSDRISFSHKAGESQLIRVYGTNRDWFDTQYGGYLKGKGALNFSFNDIFDKDAINVVIQICTAGGETCFGLPIPIGPIWDTLFPKRAPFAYNDKSDGQIPGSDWALDCGKNQYIHINVPLSSTLGQAAVEAGNALSGALGGMFTFKFVYDPKMEIINPSTGLKQIPTELSGPSNTCTVQNRFLCGAEKFGINALILNQNQNEKLFCNQVKNDSEFLKLANAIGADPAKCAAAATLTGGWGNGNNNDTFVFSTGKISIIQAWAFDTNNAVHRKVLKAMMTNRLLHFIVKNPGDFFGYDDAYNPVIKAELISNMKRVFPHCANQAQEVYRPLLSVEEPL